MPVRQLSAQCQGHSEQADAPLELQQGPSEPRGSSGFRTAPSRCCQRTRHLPAPGVQHHQGPRSAPARTSRSPNRRAPPTATLALVGTPLNPGVPAVGPEAHAASHTGSLRVREAVLGEPWPPCTQPHRCPWRATPRVALVLELSARTPRAEPASAEQQQPLQPDTPTRRPRPLLSRDPYLCCAPDKEMGCRKVTAKGSLGV